MPTLTTSTEDTDAWARYTNEEIWGWDQAARREAEPTIERLDDVEKQRTDSQVSPRRMSPFRMTSEELFEGTDLAHRNSTTGLVDFQKIDARLDSADSQGRPGRSQ